MNMWTILKINKTKDTGAIKSAYSKLKSTASSQEAKIISTAYDYALKVAGIRETRESYIEELLLEMAFERYWLKHSPDAGAAGTQGAVEENPTVVKGPLYDDFFNQLQRVYDNFFNRRVIMNWKSIINQNVYWGNSKANLESGVQQFLITHRNMPSDVWEMFDAEYGWSPNVRTLVETNKPFARCLLIELCQKWKLDYSFINRDTLSDYEGYIDYRRRTREAALENDMDAVRENFDHAIDIFTNDPILYVITADFYESQQPFIKYGEFGPEFLHALNKLIKIHYDDVKYLMMRAAYNKSCEYFEDARDDLEAAMKLCPENLRIPYEIADSYRIQQMDGKAKGYLKQIKKVYEKTQMALEKRVSTDKDPGRISEMIDSNDRVIGLVFEIMK
jgi:hypothetical protein